jgi:type II secretory pathway pseudopilin PulG
VVTIISMLVGLLMPALQAARGRARIATCTNNQHELSLAITQYDIAKRHLPGYANLVRGTNMGWIPVLFPYIGRNDLWEDTSGWRYGYNAAATPPTPVPHINQLVCPDDAVATALPDGACLSYTVNVGSAAKLAPATEVDSSKINTAENQGAQNSLFRNLALYPTRTISLSSVPSASQRPLLSERPRIDSSTAIRYWSNTTNTTKELFDGNYGYANANVTLFIGLTAQRYGFNFVSAAAPYILDTVNNITPPPNTFLISNDLAIPSVNHPGLMIVTFCDGSTRSLNEDAVVRDFDYSPLR